MWTHKKGDRTNSAAHVFAMKLLGRLKETLSIHGTQSGMDRARMPDGTEVTVSWSGSIPTIKIVSPHAVVGDECAIYMESGMLDLGVNSAASRWDADAFAFDASPASLSFGSAMTCATFGGMNGGVQFQVNGGVTGMTSACLGESGSSSVASRLTSPANKVAQARHPASAYSGLLRRYISAVYGAKYVEYESVSDASLGLGPYVLSLNGTWVSEKSMTSAKYTLVNIARIDGALRMVMCKRLFSSVCQVAFVAPTFKTKCHEYVYEFWRTRGARLDDDGELKILAIALCGMLPPADDVEEYDFTASIHDGYSFNFDGTKVATYYLSGDYHHILVQTFSRSGGGYANSINDTPLSHPYIIETPTGTIERVERVFYEWGSKELSVVTFYSEIQTEENFLPYSECAVDGWDVGAIQYSIFDQRGWYAQYPLNSAAPSGSTTAAPGIGNCSDATKKHRVIEGYVKRVNGIVTWSNTLLLDLRINTSRLAATYLSDESVYATDSQTYGDSSPGLITRSYGPFGTFTSGKTTVTGFGSPSGGSDDDRVEGCYTQVGSFTSSYVYEVTTAQLDALCSAAGHGGFSVVGQVYSPGPHEEIATASRRDSFVCAGHRVANIRYQTVWPVKGQHTAFAIQSFDVGGGFDGIFQRGVTQWWSGHSIELADTFDYTCTSGTTLTYTDPFSHDYSDSFACITKEFYCADSSQWDTTFWNGGFGLLPPTSPPYTPVGDRQKGSFYRYDMTATCVYEGMDDATTGSYTQRIFPNTVDTNDWYAANPSYVPTSLDLSYSDCQSTLLMFEDIPAAHDPASYERSTAPFTEDIEFDGDEPVEDPVFNYRATSGMLGGMARPDVTLGNAGSINSDRQIFTGGYPAVSNPSFIGWA